MAIIGKIREKSTLVLIIIGGAIVAFVLSDLFSSGAGGRTQGPLFLAEVNEETISPDEYQNQLQVAYENYQARSEEELDARTKASIRENVWNQMLSAIIIGDEREKLGVQVTTKELFDMVQGQNPHPQVRQLFTNPETGEFSSAAVVQFLQNLDQGDPRTKEQWLSFEKALKSNQEMDKYNNLIKKGLYLPTELAKSQYIDNNTNMSFKYVAKMFQSIPDSTIVLDEADVKAYYEDHKDEYQQVASRRMYYAYFPVRPSAADEEATEREANKIYEKFKVAKNDSTFVNANSDLRFDPNFYTISNIPMGIDTAFWRSDSGEVKPPFKLEDAYFIHKVRDVKMAPDSVMASHILINMQERTPEAAEQLADSLLDLLNAGAEMSALASFSDDVGSAADGGNLGWFTEGTMVKPFNDAAFSMETGEYRKVLSQFGYHIIEVTDRTAPQRKVQFASIMLLVDPSKETYADAFNNANSFSIDATDGETFNNMITEKNIQRRIGVLSESMSSIDGDDATRDLVRWGQNANEGDISEAYDIGDAFAVGYLEQINEEGPAPLDQVRNRVEFMVRNNEKAKIMMEKMGGYTDMGELAAAFGLSVENASGVTFASPSIPSAGMEPKVVGKAMTMEAGQMSVPIQGDNGVYVIMMENKVSAQEANIALSRGSSERGQAAQIDNGAIFNALKEETNIEDNRAKFF